MYISMELNCFCPQNSKNITLSTHIYVFFYFVLVKCVLFCHSEWVFFHNEIRRLLKLLYIFTTFSHWQTIAYM